jgi:hypothetical protein
VPKIKYQEFKFRPPTVALIETANTIIAEYQRQGFDLTLRQLYYQFVSRDVIPNTQRAYKNLGSIVNDGHPRSFRQPPVRPVQDFMAHLVHLGRTEDYSVNSHNDSSITIQCWSRKRRRATTTGLWRVQQTTWSRPRCGPRGCWR